MDAHVDVIGDFGPLILFDYSRYEIRRHIERDRQIDDVMFAGLFTFVNPNVEQFGFLFNHRRPFIDGTLLRKINRKLSSFCF